MKQCRLSIHNQVIETFETGKYDGMAFDFIRNEIHDCPDGVEPLMWYNDGNYHVHEPLVKLKREKFTRLLISAEQALKAFHFQGLTFESSGESKSNLMFVQSQMQSNPTMSVPWLALNGTYQLGEQNLVMIDATNIGAFAEAMKLKNEQVFVWQLTQQNALETATTIEEVEAVDVEYHG